MRRSPQVLHELLIVCCSRLRIAKILRWRSWLAVLNWLASEVEIFSDFTSASEGLTVQSIVFLVQLVSQSIISVLKVVNLTGFLVLLLP